MEHIDDNPFLGFIMGPTVSQDQHLIWNLLYRYRRNPYAYTRGGNLKGSLIELHVLGNLRNDDMGQNKIFFAIIF